MGGIGQAGKGMISFFLGTMLSGYGIIDFKTASFLDCLKNMLYKALFRYVIELLPSIVLKDLFDI